MSSLLLQSVSNALLRSATSGEAGGLDGAAAVAAAAAAPASLGGVPPASTGFDAAAVLAAASGLQLPAPFDAPTALVRLLLRRR